MNELANAKKKRNKAREDLRSAIQAIQSCSNNKVTAYEALHAIVDTVIQSIDSIAADKSLVNALAQTYLSSTIAQSDAAQIAKAEAKAEAEKYKSSSDNEAPVEKCAYPYPSPSPSPSPYGVPVGTMVMITKKKSVTAFTSTNIDAGYSLSSYYPRHYTPADGYTWAFSAANVAWLKPIEMGPDEPVYVYGSGTAATGAGEGFKYQLVVGKLYNNIPLIQSIALPEGYIWMTTADDTNIYVVET